MALRAGRIRRASGPMMSIMGAHVATRRVMRVLGRLLGPVLLGHWDTDLLATIEAEDAFDLHDRLAGITAPTLVGGGRDACYGRAPLAQTAASRGTS